MQSSTISQRMMRQRRQDTLPEMRLRRRLHRAGYRYRVSFPIEGTRRSIDIAFTRVKLAVFIDGCFWHSCPEHGTIPKSNTQWWVVKLGRNVARDIETCEYLEGCGWVVLRFWEHQDPDEIFAKVVRVFKDLKMKMEGGV